MRHAREYKGCQILPIEGATAVYFGKISTSHYWKVVFPDDSWVFCHSLPICKRHIDRVLAVDSRRSTRYPQGKALALLHEAARRKIMFYPKKAYTAAWTGLGTATQYRPAADKGLMTIATSPNPGFATWWRLTPKGARIVRWWIEDGKLGREDFEHGLALISNPYELPCKLRYATD